MDCAKSGGPEDERRPFEIEDETERPSPSLPYFTHRPPRPGSPSHLAKPRASQRGRAARQPQCDERSTGAPSAILDDRLRRRLLAYGPVMLLLYLSVGWSFVGADLGWFALAGLLVGLFAGWRQRGAVLLGSAATVVGFAAGLLVAGRPLLYVFVSTGVIGFVAGIVDRLTTARDVQDDWDHA